ncbi:hypothetical protein [Paraflavitalea speifideaquila]|uniref:hypothetical protein n=1 Tax=Paraflavitalea speifideaquila TaxID=3076558 RepID=UPI0028E81402|nr:hypothetical protein [Paraflavitalea speifideiaquila]
MKRTAITLLVFPLLIAHLSCKFKCETCSGKGVLECSLCDAKGKLDCENCEGEGTTECSSCEGDGFERCSWCYGEGEKDASIAWVMEQRMAMTVMGTTGK